MPSHSGAIRLFRFSGIQVYLHWSWFLVAMFEISARAGGYSSPVWNAGEYLMLFAIVTLHEFGHALACRQTGGQAHEIILWPLGGIAFVSPPQRPGATLWSIAAGPLVNVALVPVFGLALWLALHFGWTAERPDLEHFLVAVNYVNGLLLVFNILPIYPLDGGQILRSLLWFPLGRARSLKIAAIIGILAIVVGALWQLLQARSFESVLWTGVMALFLGQRCWIGLKEARALTALQRLPRHPGFACPACHATPPGGPIWVCSHCRQPFDPFSTEGVCPHCGTARDIPCAFCGAEHTIEQWRSTQPPQG